MLSNHGLPTLDAPNGLMEAMGRRIVDHGHFRSLLSRCDPRERYTMYEALKPHLKFTPKPLDVYVGEAGYIADKKQLPTMREDGTLAPYQPMEFRYFWSTVVKLDRISKENFDQAMRYLMRDIPEDKLDEVIYKVHIMRKTDTGEDYLRVAAGLYVNGEVQRIQ
jgi:hypothetical protein